MENIGEDKMNSLESLVPPLELCKRIPAGKFEDSALALVSAMFFSFVAGVYFLAGVMIDGEKLPKWASFAVHLAAAAAYAAMLWERLA